MAWRRWACFIRSHNNKAISMHQNTQTLFQMPNDNSLDIMILPSNDPGNDLQKSPVESEILL